MSDPGSANKSSQKRSKVWKEKVILERRSLRQRKVNALSGEKKFAVGKIPEKRELHEDMLQGCPGSVDSYP